MWVARPDPPQRQLLRNDERPPGVREAFREDVRRRPTLPPRHQGSTIGAEGLSFRVRNGTGRFPFAIVPPKLYGVVASPTDAFVAEDVGVNRPQLGSCTVDA